MASYMIPNIVNPKMPPELYIYIYMQGLVKDLLSFAQQ